MLRKPYFLCFVALLSLACQPAAQASLSITSDFNDGTATGWTEYNPLGTGEYSFPGGDSYRIYSGLSPNTDIYGNSRAGSLVTEMTLADFQISVDVVAWASELPQSFGIIARVNNPGLGTSSGYFMSFSPGETSGRLHDSLTIELLQNEQPVEGAGETIWLDTPLDPQKAYTMTFYGVGNNFTGTIYEQGVPETILGTVNWTDEGSNYSSGLFGLLASDSATYDNNAGDATFDNFNAEAIPEPGLTALIFAAMTGLYGLYRRRRA